MPTKIITVALLLIIAMAATFSTCKKAGILGCHQSFAFTIGAKVYPDKDTVNIGDTIFVEVNFPTMLTDSSSGEIPNLRGGSGVSTDMGFEKLVNNSPIVLDDAVPDFDFKLINGKELSTSKPQLIKLYSFEEVDGKFLFKLAIIPKKTGTFTFNLPPSPDAEERNFRCPTFTLNYLLKNTTDQHYYLFPGGSNVTPEGADYYFYVR